MIALAAKAAVDSARKVDEEGMGHEGEVVP